MRFLVLLCGCLVALIGAEAFLVFPREAQGVNHVAVSVPQNAPAAKPVPGSVDPDWLETVLARPLFAPDRRPLPGVSVTDPGLPRLSGIIDTSDGARAIFQTDSDGKRTVVRAGDKLGNWAVASIEPDGIHLERPGERMVLNPRFASPAASGPAGLPIRK